MNPKTTGAEIRQQFIDFFIGKGHTFVPSASLVPGGDQTLLFTNAGMVQFKDVFLGTDHRGYSRAVNSQKCMRVAGKHNDLDDVGRDDTHHTFFEMLGNWSFGDYYKPEAIAWAWELLTEVWGLDRDKLWFTCFKDEKNQIPSDEEAAESWRKQPGLNPDHILFFGRKDNFWEMADTGPCGPCSEIHIDLGPQACDRHDDPGHVCQVNGNCQRYLELWNLVFIQYNRLSESELEPLPARHVDTGMGLDRVVSVLQKVPSNYKTDLLSPLLDKVQELTGHTDADRNREITPYRVIADHARAAAFLIADGVVPGNMGRNYVCRMIIRRASRFGLKIGLHDPFLAQVAEVVISNYGKAYPELERNRSAILESLTREEKRFQRTVEQGISHLFELLDQVKAKGSQVLDGQSAFDLYATHGLPFELTRDIAREENLEVDQEGFISAMEDHRVASGAGKTFGLMGGENVDIYRSLLEDLRAKGEISSAGIKYDPYSSLAVSGKILAILRDGEPVNEVMTGDQVEIVLPETVFYIESGGQVADTGIIKSMDGDGWEIRIDDVRRPAAGVIVHVGEVLNGRPKVGEASLAQVNAQRRRDIMRNHTATHLLHAELHKFLGAHARQAGSLVAPDRLRFDFNHSEAINHEQLETIEAGVNRLIFEDYHLSIEHKALNDAIQAGAMALFGEKYGETVRTITIGDDEPYSYELCGGTHVENTGDIGVFLIISEGSVAAGIRRIEAVTGREAYGLIQKRFRSLKHAATLLHCSIEEVPAKTQSMLEFLDQNQKEAQKIRQHLVAVEFDALLGSTRKINGIPTLAGVLSNADVDTLRSMTDRFRQVYKTGVIVLGSKEGNRPIIIAAISDDLVKEGWHAGDLVKVVAQVVGGGGGGRPNLAQAGGKDASKLTEAMDQTYYWVSQKSN